MTSTDILQHRLTNQHLTKQTTITPKELVAWFGAVQSQDYAGAKWALGQRLENTTDETIERAFTDGYILRTHVMRPTWHFVAPEDIRWMQMLTAPRVKSIMAYYNRTLGLTDDVFKHSNKVIVEALSGGKHLTRSELAIGFKRAGLPHSGQALGHLAMWAELDAVICSGPRKGKQVTYMLVDERAPEAQALTHDESLAELTKRYFMSHGPATVKDFVWWSGLTTTDAKKGLEMNKPNINPEVIEGKTYYYGASKLLSMPKKAYLLPNYDEYTIAYKDRDAYYTPPKIALLTRDQTPFAHAIIVNGRIVGMWKRILQTKQVIIEAKFFRKPSVEEFEAYQQAANEYGKFINLQVTLK